MQKIRDYIYYNRKEVIITFVFILLFAIYLAINDKGSNEVIDENIIKEETIEEKQNDNESLVVDIKGEVNNPGTYEVDKDKRVKDVVEDAGGLTTDANTDNVNLSEKVHDEMVIIIPNEETKDDVVIQDNKVSNSKISINDASVAELTNIKGIGPSKAQSIVDYRNQNGKFKSIEEIINVKGIGQKTFDKIKDYIRI